MGSALLTTAPRDRGYRRSKMSFEMKIDQSTGDYCVIEWIEAVPYSVVSSPEYTISRKWNFETRDAAFSKLRRLARANKMTITETGSHLAVARHA